MTPVTELHAGMVIRLEGETYRVAEAAVHAGTGKLSGFVHARLTRLETGSQTERRFHLGERVEVAEVARRSLEFSYEAGEEFFFMDPESFEQFPVPAPLIGERRSFLKEGARLPVEFLGEQPVSVIFPETADLKVVSTAQPRHATQTSTLKDAALENGMQILVPLFIKEGETVRVSISTGKYLERVREGKR